ncbi:RagB/SusD family nutrient uptake outer membrane protein [Compostibacter hankyongensis]|uniref:RagB/SusD family nutrient uptake outer membrane protein n=1 Tax=Compostibacter hankyongensis TaxID=1007089 RepID=A0ABP8G0Z3_9BACT
MKYKLYILFALVLAGCQPHLLDTVPNDRVTTAIFWTQEKDAVLACNALYNYLEGMEIFSWDAMSDIARPNQNFMDEAYIVKGTFDPLNGLIETRWNNAYKGIRAANYFLENVDKVPTEDTDLVARLKGEARFIRAYLYFRLGSVFGGVPLITKTISIEEGKALTRTPVSGIWDFVDKEFHTAAGELPDKAAEPGRITKGAALAFDARAMLFAGRYDKAAEAAKAVMDAKIYSLYPSYEKLFSYDAEDNSEVILDKQFIKSVQANNAFDLLAPYSQTAAGNIVPVKKIADAYEMSNGMPIDAPGSGFDPKQPYKNRDPRLGYSLYVPGSKLPDGSAYNSVPGSGSADAVGYKPGSTKSGFNIKKYINKEDAADRANCGINIILMRYAEVLLTYAEARIEQNKIDGSVYDAINEVRQRPDVKLPPVTGTHTQEEMRTIVRRERTTELAFEGQRFFDIRRWKTAEDVMNGPSYGMTYVDGSGRLVTIKDEAFVEFFDPKRDYVWPVPQKEIDLDPQLEQNPGW